MKLIKLIKEKIRIIISIKRYKNIKKEIWNNKYKRDYKNNKRKHRKAIEKRFKESKETYRQIVKDIERLYQNNYEL